ncbi:MAG: hypothetical protein HY918_03110 [Candidatus Doudnabacteria bacterium]|nr:hypothetical protein [Candidatus Doudnabacteria bacterium]
MPLVEPPQDIKNTIAALEAACINQQAYLEAVYNLVLDKTLHQWHHTRFQAAFRISRLFVKDLLEIWQTKDFLYCTAINYSAFILLAQSKFFTANDIKVKHIFLNFVPHQYLQVKVGEKWVDFDPAGSGVRGLPLGTHAEWFG